MKSTPLKRKTALKRAKAIRKRRLTKHQIRNAIYREYVIWLHGQPCCACKTRHNIQAAHVGQGGIGMKHGSDAETIPLCGPRWDHNGNSLGLGCHFAHDNRSGRFSVDQYDDRHIREWREYQIKAHRARFESRNDVVGEVPF